MEKIGFKHGVYNPCTYHRPECQIEAMVHGSEHCSVGQRNDIERFRKHLDKRFSIKTTVGSGANDGKEVAAAAAAQQQRRQRRWRQGWRRR